MNLYLLRHADAEPGEPDEKRHLTSKGEKQVRQLADFLDERELPLDIKEIWHSPLTRALETAKVLAKALKLDTALLEAPGLKPDDDPRPMALRLACARKSLLVVGHNPHFESLASLLLSGQAEPVVVDFKKAGLLHLERADNPSRSRPFGTWVLAWYVVPKLF